MYYDVSSVHHLHENSNVTIRNGELGLSSHHGVHSNNASNLLFKDLIINEFEVAGIALNGFFGATFKDLDIGPSFHKVAFAGFAYF